METYGEEEDKIQDHKSAKTKVYSWGNGKGGNLGNGSIEYEALPFNVKELNKKNIVKIQCGEWFCLALSANGILYGWGKASRSRFELKGDGDIVYKPTKIPLSFKVKAFSGGYWHSLVVSTEGQVYSVGDNKKGALGLGHTSNVDEFTEVPDLENIVQVSAGSGFSFFLDNEGKLFSCGGGANGHKGKGNITKPTEITIFEEPVKYIDSGIDHAACITESGKLYTWGANTFKQLGHGSSISTSKVLSTPKVVSELEEVNIVNVSCSKGLKHCQTSCVDSEGRAYFWGCGYKGKLGNVDDWVHIAESDEDKPKALRMEGVAFTESGGIHSSLVDTEGNLYTFGCGSHGRLGHPRYIEGKYRHLYKESQPKKVEFFEKIGRIIDYSSTYSSNVALVQLF
ncbi:unnamed protein product [Moneuplotes crassus]|uniref:RCC1-like domain-containing protein n=2 Tax=Euplotes crassus TaxID=5936 RepID=A0AAD1UQG1_EUPCR|nr:unnamed protein product [Moneuplotes crassus]